MTIALIIIALIIGYCIGWKLAYRVMALRVIDGNVLFRSAGTGWRWSERSDLVARLNMERTEDESINSVRV